MIVCSPHHQDIDEEQQLLEEKGVALETKLRSDDGQEDEAALEKAWAEWFQLVNRKNELFRREMELYHTRRMQVCMVVIRKAGDGCKRVV